MNKPNQPWLAILVLVSLSGFALYYTNEFYTDYTKAMREEVIATEDRDLSRNLRDLSDQSLQQTTQDTAPHREFLDLWQGKSSVNTPGAFDLFVSRTAESVGVISRDNVDSSASTLIADREVPVAVKTIRLEGDFPRLVTAAQEIESSLELWGLRAIRFSPLGGSTSMEMVFALPSLDTFFSPQQPATP
jgi:hypothetical protein